MVFTLQRGRLPAPGRDFSFSLFRVPDPGWHPVYSSLESACYGINWSHNLFGFQSPCDSKLVKSVLEAAKRGLAKPVSKKEPVTPAMILDICNRFAGPNANLSDLRLATICVTACTTFLRFNIAQNAIVFGDTYLRC